MQERVGVSRAEIANKKNGLACLKTLQVDMIAGLARGTRRGPLPLLPSGPGGVHGLPLRGARLSYPPAMLKKPKKMAEREGFEPSVRVNVHTLSRRAPSTARTSLRKGTDNIIHTNAFVQHFIYLLLAESGELL